MSPSACRSSVAAVLLGLAAACGSPDRGARDMVPAAADERRYELPAAQVWAATQKAVEEDGALVELRHPTSDGGEIVAWRLEGFRVLAIVIAVEPGATRVSVSATPPNRTLADTIQSRIGERLSLQKAQAQLFGETSVETVYPRSLEASVAAAEETCRVLDAEILRLVTNDTYAQVDARDRDSRAIRFSFRRIGSANRESAVTFTSEGGGEETLEHLRREFERHLFPGQD